MFLEDLDKLIKDRKDNPAEGAYTSSLFKEGTDRILKKIAEEAGEVIIAAKNKDAEELKNESADLLFHLMVTLRNQGLSISDVDDVLRERNK
ncbi:phosphoribosyl-ATP diphosphatase [Candidatus Marinamargulisbacteria bacterium SCGC AAA071-K20]|nr:phosphoribosyl-ATP diphosphatase [Candidatus Marinamargulisbacteria bacterium SCGC AAA071-K20]